VLRVLQTKLGKSSGPTSQLEVSAAAGGACDIARNKS